MITVMIHVRLLDLIIGATVAPPIVIVLILFQLYFINDVALNFIILTKELYFAMAIIVLV